jgi:ABC-type transport system involved in cytochrome c biogenesis permease subunit
MKTVNLIGLGLLALGLAAGNLHAAGDAVSSVPFDCSALKGIVILENGRSKPLDTYAANLLRQFSGRARVDGLNALQWIGEALCDPLAATKRHVFLLNNPDTLNALGMEGGRDRYSFDQLLPHFAALDRLAQEAFRLGEKDRTTVENEIISLYTRVGVFQQLLDSFSYLTPHTDFTLTSAAVRARLHLPADMTACSVFDLIQSHALNAGEAMRLAAVTGPEASADDRELARVAQNFQRWLQSNRDQALRILPYPIPGDERWLSPWDALAAGFLDNAEIARAVAQLHALRLAYQQGNQAGFDAAAAAFNGVIGASFGDRVHQTRLDWELVYNAVDPFFKAELLYGLALLALLLSMFVLKSWLYRASVALLGLGLVLHTYGMGARMLIMARPPVTNLYETFVFVSWVAVLLGLIVEWLQKRSLGIISAGFTGFVFLMIASRYALQGDTLGMLAAVLNTNFWLAVHVITITVGYAGSVVAGIIGHVYLFQRLLTPGKQDDLDNTARFIYSTLAFGLVFTFIGTMLGGIWADQSWGRFWGWDPKENGALFIILWASILFHARLAGYIRQLGMALGSIGSIMCVVLAWFGVNLLGVGMHSYGFTSGVAVALLVFLACETVFMSVMALLIRRRERIKT